MNQEIRHVLEAVRLVSEGDDYGTASSDKLIW